MADRTHEYGRAGSAHGLARRFLIPIYGLDQLLTLAGFGMVDREFAYRCAAVVE